MTNPEPRTNEATLQAMLRQAITLRRQNDLAGAGRLLRAALAMDARNFDALHMLGVLAYENGGGEEAASLIAAAISIDGGHAAAHYNLGNALRLLKRHAEAIASYDRAIALKPDHRGAHNNRANCLCDIRRFAEGVESYDRAIAIDPAPPETWHNRGKALVELQRNDEAVESFRRALAAGGDAAKLQYELAALGAAPAPAVAPRRFIADLFDEYAERFDHHLVDQLGYNAPQATISALRRQTPAGGLDVLDLGCGTGLCAPLLKPMARTLVGVDLSSRMLGKARQRGLYDQLVNADAAAYLSDITAAFDVVTATDLFIYIGELETIFTATARALRSGGHFAFSVERCDDRDFVLLPSKRYAQSEPYLRRLAAENGLVVRCLEPCFIRKDGHADICGLVAVMQRP